MVVLSDRDIQRLMDEGRLIIQPFEYEGMTPNGYDLRVDEVWVESVDRTFTSGEVIIPGKTRFLVSTVERILLPTDVTGQLWIRSSFARGGILASFGKVDAGFDGTLTLAAYNSATTPVVITVGGTFAQLVMEGMSSEALKGYGTRSGNYQHQRGVTFQGGRKERPGTNNSNDIVYLP